MERLAIFAWTAALAALPASAREQSAAAAATAASRYAPYEFLIGEWISDSDDLTLRQTFRWGPGSSYIQYSTYLQPFGSSERLHFDGIMVWNAKSKSLDFLFAVEPGSGAQEKGTLRVIPDGKILREVELTAGDGTISVFRQTIRQIGPDSAVTSLMRRTATGWQPSFPGAENIEMRRKTRGGTNAADS